MNGATRFELLSKLGEGGMGVVYEALDRERNMRVALKTLRRLDASSLYQFKREFRALSDLSHPNIVALYELISEGDDWFLSMELVEGQDLVAYVRKQGARDKSPRKPQVSPAELARRAEHPGVLDVTLDTRIVASRARAQNKGALQFMQSLPDEPIAIDEQVDLQRLMDALSQLAQALYALHSQGMVHRDLKPANVCVTREGRVVLMDFGIVAETLDDGSKTESGPLIGTPAYMAPEQATGAPPSAAADWYAFGVILYQALTGTLPFRGPGPQLLDAKLKYDPVSPGAYTRGIPADLEALCMKLLARDPLARPHGYDVLTCLGVAAESISRLMSEVTFLGPSEFVGRSHLLKELEQAYREAIEGKAVCVIAEGASGMGKTTLLRRFVYELQATQTGSAAPIILAGRCHERESLSYKAFDGVIDQLSRELLELPEQNVNSLLPDDIDLLTRLFPVLRRIPGVQAARPLGRGNLSELRTRAVEALRSLLTNLGAWRPVVMRIEDLQWADNDSIELLIELLRVPAPPRLLLLASLRTDVNVSDPEHMSRVLDVLADKVVCHRLQVGPLAPSEQELLVAKLIGEGNLAADINDAFWAEAEGNPLLLTELARYAAEAPEATKGRAHMRDVIARRVARLSDKAQALLEIIAVAGEPTPLWLLAEAAGLSDDDRERASATLRVAKLARVAMPGHEPWLNTQHDKIRETVLARLADDRLCTLHRKLAHALERWDSATVPSLAHHWLAAGDRDQAVTFLIASARAAAEKLAFDRAAELYGAALALLGDAPPDRRALVLEPHGETLVLAGRHHEAADAYMEAAELASGERALELGRLSADSLLRCGRIEEGMQRLEDVMRRLGIRLAHTRERKVASLLVQRARLFVRGIKHTPRKESEVPSRELGRLDTLYAAATALGMVDHVLGSVVQTRHLRLALQTGEERRVCRALATEVAYLGALGGRHARRADELGHTVTLMARKLGDAKLVALAHFGTGVTAFFGNRMRVADKAFAESLSALEGLSGAEWERMTAQFFSCLSLINTGEWNRATHMLERIIERAERHRDIYAANLFKAEPNTWRWLIRDRANEAHRSIDASLEGWPRDSYYVAHYQVALSRALVRIYEGNGEAAAEVLHETIPRLGKLMLNHMPLLFSEVVTYRGRAALLMDDVATAQKCVKRLSRLDLPMAHAMAHVLEAPIRMEEGNQREAERLVSTALDYFVENHASHMVAACRYRLGQLIGGSQGDELKASAMAWMKEQNVVNPGRMLRLLTWKAPL